jgi:hypothetical protein
LTGIGFCVFLQALTMTEEVKKRKTGFYWGMCFVSAIALVLLTIYAPGGFWLGLPTFIGGLAMAMDWV